MFSVAWLDGLWVKSISNESRGHWDSILWSGLNRSHWYRVAILPPFGLTRAKRGVGRSIVWTSLLELSFASSLFGRKGAGGGGASWA